MKPLYPQAYTPFTAAELKPAGWLRSQLMLQAQGLAGTLDQACPDVRDSRWIGGERAGGACVPAWLSGFIPLAWLLEDRALQRWVHGYVNAILARQQPDGWICPCPDIDRPRCDVWPAFVLCRALILYGNLSGEDRVESAVYRILRQLNRHLDRHTLFAWGHSRWFECLLPLFWLYERRPEPWMEELCFKLRAQGMDWPRIFETGQFVKPASGGWSYMTQAVNLAMALKAEGLIARLTGETAQANARAKATLARLLRERGTALGHFAEDEGSGPALCGVAEALDSYAQMLAITGDPAWGDQLEKLAFNALPSALAAQAMPCGLREERDAPEAERAMEPEDCAATVGQGWPTFALSTLMRAPEGIAVTALAPSTLTTNLDGKPMTCALETDYPFGDAYAVRIFAPKPTDFALTLRVPGFARRATVDGRPVPPGAPYTLRRTWHGQSRVEVFLDMEADLLPRPDERYCAVRGPLVYAATQGADKSLVGFSEASLAYGRSPVETCPFSQPGPPCWLEASLAPVDEAGRAKGPPRKTRLIPYGCAEHPAAELPWAPAQQEKPARTEA